MQPKDRRLVTEQNLEDYTQTELSPVRTGVDSANERADQAVSIARSADTKSDNAVSRVEHIETIAGLAPGEVTDAQTANLIAQPESSTRVAFGDAMAAEITAPDSAGGGAFRSVTQDVIDESVKVLDKGEFYPSVYLGGKRNGAAISDATSGGVLLSPGTVGHNNVIGGNGAQTVGSYTPNEVDHTIAANGAVIAGTDNVAGSISDKIISAHSYTEPGGPGHNIILGGNGHVIRNTAVHSAIIGGEYNDVGGSYATASGLDNTVDGQSSFATGIRNTVHENARGSFTTGEHNTLESSYSAAFGYRNDALNAYSVVSGMRAQTTSAFQKAHSDGGFADGSAKAEMGSAQISEFIIRGVSTAAASKPLGLSGGTTGPSLPVSSAWIFEADVIGQDTQNGDSAAFKITGAIRRGTTEASVLIGSPTITPIAADSGASSWSVYAVASSGGWLNIGCRGEDGKTTRWVASVRVTQVRMPGT